MRLLIPVMLNSARAVALLFLAVGLFIPLDAQAQTVTHTTVLTDWPQRQLDAGEDLAAFDDVDLLPFLDTLALTYTYAPTAATPAVTFQLAWTPGQGGILDGERVSLRAFPEDIRLVSLDFEANVYVDGAPVSTLALAVDSMDLGPVPYVFPFELIDAQWDNLFPGLSADEARAVLAEGFELRDLEVIRIEFAAWSARTDEPGAEVRPRPRPPARTGIYVPRPSIWVVWRDNPYRTPPRIRRGESRPRDGDMGRDRDDDAHTDRSNPRNGEATSDDGGEDRAERNRGLGRVLDEVGKRDDDDDGDDDTQLLVAAIAGVAAVGVVAFAGGTVGYYGDANHAPIGLASGYVAPKGGFMLRVAVNDAVLGARGRERLVAQTYSFYNAFNGPVQPALGLGVWAEEDGDAIDIRPSVVLGTAIRLDAAVLQLGYDVAQQSFQLGIGYNFRHRGQVGR